MAKSFKDKSFFDNIEDGHKPEIPVPEAEHKPEVQENGTPVPQHKTGRPRTKTEETRTINIAVPVSVLRKMDVAKTCYGNNLTKYVNKAIERDLEANYSKYESISNNLNNIQ